METTEETIVACRLDGSPASVDFAMRFFGSMEMRQKMSDDDQDLASVYQAVKDIAEGRTVAYAIIDKGKGAIGMFWGHFFCHTCISGHWGIFSEFQRKGLAKQAFEIVICKVKIDFPSVSSIMGVIAKRNTASYAGALKCGFTPQGILPKSHMHNGRLIDSWIVCKEL